MALELSHMTRVKLQKSLVT